MRLPFPFPRKYFGRLVMRVMIAILVIGTLFPTQATTLAAQEQATPVPGDVVEPAPPEDEPIANEDPAPDDPEQDAAPPIDEEEVPDGIVPLPEEATGTPGTTTRTSASTMALDNGSVHITNFDQARTPLEGVQFEVLRDGTVLDTKMTTNTGVLTIHLLPTEVDLVARQVTTPAGCDPAPDQPFLIEDGPPFQTRLTFVNACDGGEVGSISVLVQDQAGGPLADVQANARYFVDPNWSGMYDSTDSSGQVTLAPVFVGYDYRVEARGLPPGCMSPPVQHVTITPDALHHSLTFISQCHDPATTGSLSIIKHDHNNVDMVGIDFEVYSGTMLVASGTTNELGRLGIENIPAGPYIIREMNTPPGCIDSGDTLVNVIAGESTAIRIENDCSGSSGKITVRVVDQYGTSLPAVTFRVETGSLIHGRWTTDPGGEAVVAPLTLNQTYEIIHETGGCAGWGTERAYLDEADPQMTVVVESFCSDATPPPADLLLVKTDETGSLLPGADFELSLDGAVIATGTSDANGEVLFTGLVPGEEYILRETAAPEGCTPGEDQVIRMPNDGSDQTTKPVNTCDGGEESTPTPTVAPPSTPIVTPTGTSTPADPDETPTIPSDTTGGTNGSIPAGTSPDPEQPTEDDVEDTGTSPGANSSGNDGNAKNNPSNSEAELGSSEIRGLPNTGSQPATTQAPLVALVLGALAVCLASIGTCVLRRR